MVSEDAKQASIVRNMAVLILVIAVDGLGGSYFSIALQRRQVLILVIAVDGLGGVTVVRQGFKAAGLNPCYSGRWSRRCRYITIGDANDSLNPCYSGRWSRR